ncbi:Uncharacterized protein AC499_1434 [Pseudomonas amygdali pv. lachrymans]|uniref:Uncharacterized protein n=1 Tax=Pseudomonas amygdali pv. lachrymans TaxID=53707 RepID=A0ABR5KRL3_PSEAV|nr:hypothetical protein [Pseudomonas amygdali]KPC17273.1 Uncharacterized protein AC499_0475 [Pseudomonas amygdali pv. lachrymans]KPC18232.1 Uncharacterized protein AC499_1434 [Pseudomonas amygdali pv. lachrymans]
MTTSIQPEDLAKMDRAEALDYLEQRITKVNSIQAELNRFAAIAGSPKPDEVWDQKVIQARRCQVVLSQAMALFEDYRDLCEWASTQELTSQLQRTLLPYAIVFETDDFKRYTSVFNWVGKGLEALPGQDRNNPPKEIEEIEDLREKMYLQFEDSLYRSNLQPSFFDSGRFRNFYLYNRIFPQGLRDQAGSIIHQSIMQDAGEDWANTLTQYKQARPSYAAAFGAIVQKQLGEFPYQGSQALREHYYGNVIPPENECLYRSWEILMHLGKGDPVTEDSLTRLLDTIRHNPEFMRRKFPAQVLQSLQEFATDDPANTDMAGIDMRALSQYLRVIREAGISASEMVHLGMTVIGRLPRDVIQPMGNLTDADKMVVIMQEYEERAYKHYDPKVDQKDALLHLILNCVPPEVISAVANVSDTGAVIAYSITGKAKELASLKDLSRAENVFGADLGL